MEWWQILLLVLGSLLLLLLLSTIFYFPFFKRFWDVIFSFLAIIVFLPLFIILIVVGTITMKANPFFVQKRPGKKNKKGVETMFLLIKFRTMSNAKDENGNLLPDEQRLNGYGKFLRSTSLDELPEAFNIFVGDMSIIGPRPQLVRDMVFMTKEQRRRHDVRPGLSGLAQVSGRNNITWEQKFQYDLLYVDKITFFRDFMLIVKTFFQAFIKRADTVREGTASDIDFGDWLLREGMVTQETYDAKMAEAKDLL